MNLPSTLIWSLQVHRIELPRDRTDRKVLAKKRAPVVLFLTPLSQKQFRVVENVFLAALCLLRIDHERCTGAGYLVLMAKVQIRAAHLPGKVDRNASNISAVRLAVKAPSSICTLSPAQFVNGRSKRASFEPVTKFASDCTSLLALHRNTHTTLLNIRRSLGISPSVAILVLGMR